MTDQGSEATPSHPMIRLTARRLGIIRYLAGDKCPDEIARLLGISRETVYEHLGELRKKLMVRTSYGLIGVAYELGILKPSGPIRTSEIPGSFPTESKAAQTGQGSTEIT